MWWLPSKRPIVFLSATSLDLAEQRGAVAEVLKRTGLRVLEMEQFPAMARTAAGGSTEMVRRCDVLVGIYARRYGSLTPDGRSVTECEYDEATARNMPRICFMLSDSASWPEKFIEHEPAASALLRFKQKVRSQIIVAEFSDLADLTAKVKAAADEYLQKAQRQRRLRLVLACLVVCVTAVTVVLALLLTASKPQFTLESTIKAPSEAAFTALATVPPDSLVSGDETGAIALWDLRQPGIPSRSLGSLSGRVKALRASPDGQTLYAITTTGSSPSRIVVIALSDGRIVTSADYPRPDNDFFVLAVSPNGDVVAGGSTGEVYQLRNDGSLVTVHEPPPTESDDQPSGRVIALCYSPDGRQLLISYQNQNHVLLSLDKGHSQIFAPHPRAQLIGPATAFASPKTVVVSGQFHEDVLTYYRSWIYYVGSKTSAVLGDSDNTVWNLVSCNNGRQILSSNWSGEVELWDVPSKTKLIATVVESGLGREEDKMLCDLAYDRAHHRVFGLTDHAIVVWNLRWHSWMGVTVPWERNTLW